MNKVRDVYLCDMNLLSCLFIRKTIIINKKIEQDFVTELIETERRKMRR